MGDNETNLEQLTISNIMRTEDGRKFMYRCLSNSGVFSSSLADEAHIMYFNEGRRSQGRWLAQELKMAAPESYYLMLKEHDNGNW